MKNIFRLMLIAAVATVFALPAYARAADEQAAAAQDDEAKAKLYEQFLGLIKGGPEQQRQASAVGKEYMTKYPAPADAADKQIFDYIKNWVSRYDQAVRDYEFKQTLANKNFARSLEMGRQMLAENPDNVDLALTLARVALANANAGPAANKSLYPESLRATRNAIQLLESGKAPSAWEAPFTNRDETLGWLYYAQGLLTVESSPAEAVTALIKSAQINGATKTAPATYFHLGNAYVAGDYKKAVDAYNAVFPQGKEITEDLKPQYEQLIGQVNAVLDRVIDAYARAAALSTKPDQKAFRDSLTAQITEFHKARYQNSTAADVQTLINGVLSKPLPMPGQTPTAPAAASTTPTASTNAAPAQTPAAGNGARPAATPAGNGAKPAATPAGTTKPKRR